MLEEINLLGFALIFLLFTTCNLGHYENCDVHERHSFATKHFRYKVGLIQVKHYLKNLNNLKNNQVLCLRQAQYECKKHRPVLILKNTDANRFRLVNFRRFGFYSSPSHIYHINQSLNPEKVVSVGVCTIVAELELIQI